MLFCYFNIQVITSLKSIVLNSLNQKLKRQKKITLHLDWIHVQCVEWPRLVIFFHRVFLSFYSTIIVVHYYKHRTLDASAVPKLENHLIYSEKTRNFQKEDVNIQRQSLNTPLPVSFVANRGGVGGDQDSLNYSCLRITAFSVLCLIILHTSCAFHFLSAVSLNSALKKPGEGRYSHITKGRNDCHHIFQGLNCK